MTGWSARRAPDRRTHDRRPVLRAGELGDLTGAAAVDAAPDGLAPRRDSAPPIRACGCCRSTGTTVWMSWEDVALVIMGPRSNKTSALAVPTVLAAPGLAVATSNKADLWALTAGMRSNAGRCGRSTRSASPTPADLVVGSRCAASPTPTRRTGRSRRPAGRALRRPPSAARDATRSSTPPANKSSPPPCSPPRSSGGTLRDVVEWLQPGRRDAIAALDTAGADTEAADLEATLSGADVTTKGIFQTARTATKALTSRAAPALDHPARHLARPTRAQRPAELDLWTSSPPHGDGRATLHLLSKEGAGTAAPVVTALVDRLLEIAELLAQARGGRLDPPVVAVLDEAANICPIRALPQLYSHYGSRGIQVLTMLQSYQQGVGVWGDQGMHALWSAATVKLVGAGVDDHAFLQRLSGLIGDHDVERVSTSVDRTRASRQYPTPANPSWPPPTCARCPATGPCCSPPDAAPGSATCTPGTANATPPTSPPTPTPRWPSSAPPPPPPSAPTTPSTDPRSPSHDQRPNDTARPACSPICAPASRPSRPGEPTSPTCSTNSSTAAPTADATEISATTTDDDEIDLDGLIEWVHATVTAIIARPLRGELTWCPLWWEHPEAVFRLEALRRAWTELAPEPGAAMSIWIRDHLDPCLRELLQPRGPFADCATGGRLRGPHSHSPLPTLREVMTGQRAT